MALVLSSFTWVLGSKMTDLTIMPGVNTHDLTSQEVIDSMCVLTIQKEMVKAPQRGIIPRPPHLYCGVMLIVYKTSA